MTRRGVKSFVVDVCCAEDIDVKPRAQTVSALQGVAMRAGVCRASLYPRTHTQRNIETKPGTSLDFYLIHTQKLL